MSTEKLTLNTDEITTQLSEITKEVADAQKKQSKVVIITNEKEVKEATEFLTQLKAKLKKTEELRATFTKPINGYLKMVNAMFKEKTEPLQEIEVKVKRAISNYVLEQERLAAKEEERLQKLQDRKNERREANGKELDLTEISVDRPETTIHVETGKSITVKVWKFEIEDEIAVPRKYCLPDTSLIRQAVKNGEREIKGVHIYEDIQVNITPF